MQNFRKELRDDNHHLLMQQVIIGEPVSFRRKFVREYWKDLKFTMWQQIRVSIEKLPRT